MHQGRAPSWSMPSEDDANASDDSAPCGDSPRGSRAARQKQAQQRYRKRRKERLAEMEIEVAELARQDKASRRERAALGQRQAELQARVSQLEMALEKKDFEAEALRIKLLGTTGTKAGAGGVASPAPTPPSGSSRSRKAAERKEADAQLQGCTIALASFLEEHNLRASPLDGFESMPAESQQRLRGLLAAFNVFSAKLRPAQAASGAPHHTTLLGGGRGDAVVGVDAERWVALAGKLGLSPAQRRSLLDIRNRQRAWLAELEGLRKELCMQAMVHMLPTLRLGMSCASLAPQDPSDAAEVGAATAALYEHITNIKEVLRQEQQALTEMDDTVMQRVLRPAQCAVLIVDTFPAAAVALPLAEAVATIDGDPEAPVAKKEPAFDMGPSWPPTGHEAGSFHAAGHQAPTSRIRHSKRQRVSRGFGHDGGFGAALSAAA